MSDRVLTGEESALLQSFIDSFDFYVLVVDENHHIVHANEAVGAAFGMDPRNLVGRHCPQAIHGVTGRFEGCPLETSVLTGKAEKAELFDARLGRWLDSRIYPAPFRTPSGDRIYLHFVFDITEKRNAQDHLNETLAKLRASLGGIIRIAQEVVEKRDPYTAGHHSRVADLARSIAEEMGLSEDQRDSIRMAAVIHDIGNISVPAGILSKSGVLSEAEFGLIKEHCRTGYEILKGIRLPWPIADIVLQHHERLDGSGYPQGLKGDLIMLEARILAVADVVEAMSSHRPYRPALGIDRALKEVKEQRAVLYDPGAVDACCALFEVKGYRLKEGEPHEAKS